MTPFSNQNIKDKLCGGCDCTGFAPAVAFSLNTGTNVVTFTDTTAYGTGAARDVIHFTATDKNGKQAKVSMLAADGDGVVTLDLTPLDRSEGVALTATVKSNKGCISDGNFFGVGIHATVGNLAYWDKDNDSITV